MNNQTYTYKKNTKTIVKANQENNKRIRAWRNLEILTAEGLQIAQTNKYDFKLSEEELRDFNL